MRNKDQFKALNSALPVFYLEELEERLETDPLMTSGLFELEQDHNEDGDCVIYICKCNVDCQDYSTSCEKHVGG